MALAFKLWWCPWSIRLGQRLPFGTSYALMVVLLINFIQSWRLFSDHLSTASVVLLGAIATQVTRLTDAAGWKIACGISFGTIGTRWSGGKPPLQGHNLGALHLDYFDLLASLALTVICQSFYNARFSWLPALVGLLTRFIIFWFAEPGQIKFCAAFPHWPFGWKLLFVFLHYCQIWQRSCFSSSRRRRRTSISGCCQEGADDAVMKW